MGSSSKSSGAQQDNYYGTLAGAVCKGPVDALVAIVLGGKYWYKPTTPLVRGAETFVDLPDTRPGARSGFLRLYWGTETQVADPVLQALLGADEVPPYRGVCYFVLVDFLFGTGMGSAPNLEFIVRRKPLQSVVSGAAAALDSDAQANPVALAAEVATAWYGLDLPAAGLDGAGWQALADEVQATAESRALVNCSPLWTQQAAARSLFIDLGATGDLWFRAGAEGAVEVGRWREAGPAGAITTLDANALEADLSPAAEGVDELPTSVAVDFADRAYAYADSSEKVDELALLRQQGRPSTRKLRRMQVTRREQARAQAAAELRRAGRVVLRGSARVRRARAVHPGGADIRPGDWFALDVDPEPGGEGVALLCRCTGRSSGPTGPVTLEWESDPGAVPEPYQPEYGVDSPALEVIAPLDVALVLALPGDDDAEEPSVSVLAVRGDETWERVEVFYSDQPDGDYVSLGDQVGFACPATLVDPVSELSEVIRLALVEEFDGLNGPVDGTLDADLLREAVGSGTELAARNDELLLVLVKLAGAGGIAAASDRDWVEVCSVIDVTPVSAGVYDVSVIRARQGTRRLEFDPTAEPVSFPADSYQAWCLPRSRLARLRHRDFTGHLAQGTAMTFRLAAASAVASYNPEDAEAAGLQPGPDWRPQYDYAFPAGYRRTPALTVTAPFDGAQVPTSGLLAVDIAWADGQGDLVEASLVSSVEATGTNYVEHLRKLMPATGSFAFSGNITLPAVEGLHRLVVQGRDLGGRVTQRELSVFRFTSSTPVPPPICEFIQRGYMIGGFEPPLVNGSNDAYYIARPGGIDYGAVPHTLHERQRRSNGTWTAWATWAANWPFTDMPEGANYMLPKGVTREFRLQRDGDSAVSSSIPLTGIGY